MKSILVPTDFSSSANNAALYAAAIAKEVNAKLILLHSFQVPVPPSDIPATAISIDDLQENNERFLRKEANRIQRHYHVEIEIITEPGFAVEEIHAVEKNKKPDMIIMGTRGAGKIKEVIIGSTATAVIRGAQTPVLLIPEKAEFVKPEKIILACDYKVGINLNDLSFLKYLAEKLNSEIYLVNIVPDKEAISSAEKGVEALKVGHYFGNVKCSNHFPQNKDFILGMDEFSHTHKAAMITIISQKHNLLERLFSESHTTRMAFHSKLPLLALPGTHK
ncbi:MAG: universal stress protein [Bacteroidetes bacterium]|nr:universal stress protein [Bacteroidota bacterium]